MIYNDTERERMKNSIMDKILSEIMKVLIYSDKMDKENTEDVSESVDRLMMNYLWKIRRWKMS